MPQEPPLGQRPVTRRYQVGDVFASVGGGLVRVFTPTGALVCSLDDGTGATYTTGSAFDAAGNFYVANVAYVEGLGYGEVSKFNNMGGLVSSTFMAVPRAVPISIVPVSSGPYSGSSFVGESATPSFDQFNTGTGALVKTWSAVGGDQTGGTDWMALLPDGHTIIYDGSGSAIRSYNLATSTQNPDFTTPAAKAALHNIGELAVIPKGPYAGDVLVANADDAVMLNSSGNIIKTYRLCRERWR